MKKHKIGLFVGAILLGLSLVGCSKKTSKDNTTKPTETEETTTTEAPAKVAMVAFDSNGGSTVNNQMAIVGQLIPKPADPERKGYTFNGWYNGETLWDFDKNKLEAEGIFTLKANWSINKYSITLDNQATGVTISGITSGNEYDYNSEITLTATNILDGYILKWSINDEIVSTGDTYAFNVPADDIAIIITAIPLM